MYKKKEIIIKTRKNFYIENEKNTSKKLAIKKFIWYKYIERVKYYR